MLNKIEKDLLTAEFSQVWGKDNKMTSYCVGKTSNYATLPDGKIITIDKQGIKTQFCFGESGYDYDDAQAAAAHARKSEDYFKEKNMESFNRYCDDLQEAITDAAADNLGKYAVIIGLKNYYRQPDTCKLAYVSFIKWWEVIDALEAAGQACKVAEMPGKEITYRGQLVRIATIDELNIILDAYKQARTEHEKKVNSYLKRYGLSKVHSWTYWRDA